MKALFFLISSLLVLSASGQSIIGRWKTIDDNTGKARSVVEIYEKEGKYFGKILQLFSGPDEDPDPVCDQCEDHRKDQEIIGMEVISDMEYDKEDKEYEEGEILDPENGNIYSCKLWLDEKGNLKVRGYLYFLYRTQTWLPYKGE